MRPDSFQVRRSATINAAPEKIFPLINDLHRFNSWNPFEKKDPNLKRSYSGPESGKGGPRTPSKETATSARARSRSSTRRRPRR